VAHDDTGGGGDGGDPEAPLDDEARERLDDLVLSSGKLSRRQAEVLRASFRDLFRAQRPFVERLLRRQGLAEHETDDSLQEVFLAAYRYIEAKGFPENLEGLLHEITRKTLSNLRRVRRRAPLSVALPSSRSEQPPSEPGVDSVTATRDLAWRMFETLSPEHQAVAERVIVGRMTADQAAAELGLPLGTVRSRALAAKKAMLTQASRLLPPSERGPR
jgi:RNA polymerase sigma-70 factor, ECF subfamily